MYDCVKAGKYVRDCVKMEKNLRDCVIGHPLGGGLVYAIYMIQSEHDIYYISYTYSLLRDIPC